MRLFIEDVLRDMEGRIVYATPLSVDTLIWDKDVPDSLHMMDEMAEKHAPPKANGYATGPFRVMHEDAKSCFGIVYFKIEYIEENSKIDRKRGD